MKNTLPAIRSLMVSDPIVNGIIAGRAYHMQLPQGITDPSIVFQRITAQFDYTQDGPSGLVNTLMQIDAVSTSRSEATTLGNAVHDVLSGHSGEVIFGSGSPQESVTIHGIFNTNERDAFDTVTDMFALQRDFIVWYWSH